MMKRKALFCIYLIFWFRGQLEVSEMANNSEQRRRVVETAIVCDCDCWESGQRANGVCDNKRQERFRQLFRAAKQCDQETLGWSSPGPVRCGPCSICNPTPIYLQQRNRFFNSPSLNPPMLLLFTLQLHLTNNHFKLCVTNL